MLLTVSFRYIHEIRGIYLKRKNEGRFYILQYIQSLNSDKKKYELNIDKFIIDTCTKSMNIMFARKVF